MTDDQLYELNHEFYQTLNQIYNDTHKRKTNHNLVWIVILVGLLIWQVL